MPVETKSTYVVTITVTLELCGLSQVTEFGLAMALLYLGPQQY